jgi:hypothetical protein
MNHPTTNGRALGTASEKSKDFTLSFIFFNVCLKYPLTIRRWLSQSARC